MKRILSATGLCLLILLAANNIEAQVSGGEKHQMTFTPAPAPQYNFNAVFDFNKSTTYQVGNVQVSIVVPAGIFTTAAQVQAAFVDNTTDNITWAFDAAGFVANRNGVTYFVFTTTGGSYASITSGVAKHLFSLLSPSNCIQGIRLFDQNPPYNDPFSDTDPNNNPTFGGDYRNNFYEIGTTTAQLYNVYTGYQLAAPACSTLPVEFAGFSGTASNCEAVLKWSTATEQNSDRFEIEQSTDGANWTVAATIRAAGNSNMLLNYQAAVPMSQSGSNYFRIRQVDADGRAHYTNIIRLSCSGRAAISAYPNPVIDRATITGLTPGDKGMLVDAQGRMIWTRTFAAGVETINLSTLANGMYLLKIVNREGESNVIKLQKQ